MIISNIKRARNLKRIRKIDAAKRLNISQKSLYNYEHGGTVPSDILIKMSILYGCTVDYLLGLNDYNTIIVAKNHRDCLEPVAVIEKDRIIEHCGYTVKFSVD